MECYILIPHEVQKLNHDPFASISFKINCWVIDNKTLLKVVQVINHPIDGLLLYSAKQRFSHSVNYSQIYLLISLIACCCIIYWRCKQHPCYYKQPRHETTLILHLFRLLPELSLTHTGTGVFSVNFDRTNVLKKNTMDCTNAIR